jgi:hypothetical protein
MKKIWANLQRIIELLKKTKFQLFGIRVQDLGSGKNLFRIPDPWVKKADPQH